MDILISSVVKKRTDPVLFMFSLLLCCIYLLDSISIHFEAVLWEKTQKFSSVDILFFWYLYIFFILRTVFSLSMVPCVVFIPNKSEESVRGFPMDFLSLPFQAIIVAINRLAGLESFSSHPLFTWLSVSLQLPAYPVRTEPGWDACGSVGWHLTRWWH